MYECRFMKISWPLFGTGVRSRTVWRLLYHIAFRTVVKLVITSANIATLLLSYAPMNQRVEKDVSETLSAWKVVVTTWNQCWNSLGIGT